ncbi:unnamed protein product [Schistocephalus solidus]|uniref:Sushi domain-containing protein n=1 Tax=Schistocephalus solidus TaxID=70667 RepID=A0A183TMT6_SCHSO|nr:unnamed protein product [Schistocephalus solidus]
MMRLSGVGEGWLESDELDLTNEAMARNGTFRAACEYKLICDKGAIKCEPYPACDDMNWGPAWLHEKHYGLQLDQPVGVLSLPAGKLLPDGQIEPGILELGCTKNRPEVQLYCKLKRNGYTDSELERYHRLIVSDRKAAFELTLPEPGNRLFPPLAADCCVPVRSSDKVYVQTGSPKTPDAGGQVYFFALKCEGDGVEGSNSTGYWHPGQLYSPDESCCSGGGGGGSGGSVPISSSLHTLVVSLKASFCFGA